MFYLKLKKISTINNQNKVNRVHTIGFITELTIYLILLVNIISPGMQLCAPSLVQVEQTPSLLGQGVRLIQVFLCHQQFCLLQQSLLTHHEGTMPILQTHQVFQFGRKQLFHHTLVARGKVFIIFLIILK